MLEAHERLVAEEGDEALRIVAQTLVVVAGHARMAGGLGEAASSATDAVNEHTRV